MKITMRKFINNSEVVIEEDCTIDNLTETRRAMAKAIRYSLADLEKAEKGTKEDVSAPVQQEPLLPLASDKQLAYMAKLGIPYWEGITKIDAIKAINDYKVAHNIPVKGDIHG